MAVYMMMWTTSAESAGAPRWCASAVSGSSTGSVAWLAPGAVAHSPVKAYLGWHQASYGRFDFVDYDSQFLYGRLAQFADCTGASLPRYERPLCPRQPPAQRNVDFYMWNPRSPQVTLQAPPGMNKGYITQDFDRRILEHQPLSYLKVVAGDVLYSFSPVRRDGPERYPVWYLQFHPYFPAEKGKGEVATIRASTGRGPHVQPALAGFLTGYGRDFYVPGPLLAAGLALGVVGMAGIGLARRSGLRAPCLLFTIGAIVAVEPRSSSPPSTGGTSCRNSP
jgi:hypothetical protein